MTSRVFGKDIVWSFDLMVLRVFPDRIEQLRAEVSGFAFSPPVQLPKDLYPPKKQPCFVAHHGRANRTFVDGHLESEDLRKSIAASDAQLKRWNVDHESHRDRLGD